MSKGAKFRLTPSVSKLKLWHVLEESMSKLKKKLARKCKVKEATFVLWYDVLMKKLKHRQQSISSDSLHSNDIFELKSVKSYLRKLHNRFVIVPVDKAANNFAIVCKAFYIQVLMKELGIDAHDKISGNSVYQHIDINLDEFFAEQEVANNQLGNSLEEENRHIPLLYWTSKQHKNPFKFRFIAGASRCTNKTIAKDVALALKHIKLHFKRYCGRIRERTGLNFFWCIDNSVEFLAKLSDVESADAIKTFDFSTLYTNLPLDDIFESLSLLINKIYNHSKAGSIMVNSKNGRTYWCRGSNHSGYTEYTQDKLLDALKFILFNTYVQFGGKVFKQIKGIPMGGNASPFIADLYLAWHEYCFMFTLSKSKLEEDKRLARLLSNNSRYIDDISVINFLDFGSVAKRIYHKSLLLEESESGYHYDTFLDLNIRIVNRNFVIGIYHKVDDFNFEVINFPFPSSNIHSQVGYNTFYSQLVRFYRLCNNVHDFIMRVNLIRKKLSARGYSETTLHRYFLRFCNRYPVCIKYGISENSEALWKRSFIDHSWSSCCVFDTDAVRRIVRPCSVVLETMSDSLLLNYLDSDNADRDVDSFQVSSDEQVDSSMDNPVICILPVYQPTGLENPSNHCYLNSVLQMLHRTLAVVHGNFHHSYVDTIEGDIIKKLVDCNNPQSNCSLTDVKCLLQRYDKFFDGLIQRDALECINRLLDLIHKGTTSLIVELTDSLLEDPHYCIDDFTASLFKDLFSFSLTKIMKCESCSFVSTPTVAMHELRVFPKARCTISQIVEECLNDSYMKTCAQCLINTEHSITFEFRDKPKFLFIIINRYIFSSSARKNRGKVKVERVLSLRASNYHLISSIHHHGDSTDSGHYTARVFHGDSAYFINDSRIQNLDDVNYISDSVYLLIYELGNM